MDLFLACKIGSWDLRRGGQGCARRKTLSGTLPYFQRIFWYWWTDKQIQMWRIGPDWRCSYDASRLVVLRFCFTSSNKVRAMELSSPQQVSQLWQDVWSGEIKIWCLCRDALRLCWAWSGFEAQQMPFVDFDKALETSFSIWTGNWSLLASNLKPMWIPAFLSLPTSFNVSAVMRFNWSLSQLTPSQCFSSRFHAWWHPTDQCFFNVALD